MNPASGRIPLKYPAQRRARARQLNAYYKETYGMTWFDEKKLKAEIKRLALKICDDADPFSDDGQAALYIDHLATKLDITVRYKDCS